MSRQQACPVGDESLSVEVALDVVPSPDGVLRVLLKRVAGNLQCQQDAPAMVAFMGDEVGEGREDSLLEATTFFLTLVNALQ